MLTFHAQKDLLCDVGKPRANLPWVERVAYSHHLIRILDNNSQIFGDTQQAFKYAWTSDKHYIKKK